MKFDLQWATPDGHPANMPRLADLEHDGWRVIGKDPRYRSLLMRRDVEEGDAQ